MKSRTHPLLALLALLLVLTACSGGPAIAQIPAPTVDVNDITLVPFTSSKLGIRGVMPEGWFAPMPGDLPGFLLAGPPEDRPTTTLIQHLEAGATLDDAAVLWLPRLGLDEPPERTGQRATANATWDLYAYELKDPDLGPRKGSIAAAETSDGTYLVILITAPRDHQPLREALFLPAVDALGPAADISSRFKDYVEWPVAASIEGVGNNALETARFTLDRCTSLRVYAIGEGSARGMLDYGYIEDASTGQRLWQMYYFETESAGYPRNRRVDRALTLPPGTYRLHFRTNGSHAFEDWGELPPGHHFWGISLFEDRSPGASSAACWPRASQPEELGWSSAGLSQTIPELERLDVAALMIVTGGQVAFEWGNTANNFRSHSMRKSLLSALYGVYVADGAIDTSRTLAELGIDDLLPLSEGEKQATVADLLKARSGIYIPAAAEAQSMVDDRPKRGSHPPGAFWCYNNWDFNALGTIFRQETGQDLFEAFGARLAGPLGMQDFRLQDQHYSYEYWLSQHPAYPFRISARDLARLGQLYLEEGEWQGAQVVPADWVQASTRAYSDTGKSGTYSGYGYMWWVAAEDLGGIKKGSYTASGMGGHTVEVLPHLDTVIVVRFNTDDAEFMQNYAGSPVDELILSILQARQDPADE